jgi:hypothetical protein
MKELKPGDLNAKEVGESFLQLSLHLLLRDDTFATNLIQGGYLESLASLFNAAYNSQDANTEWPFQVLGAFVRQLLADVFDDDVATLCGPQGIVISFLRIAEKMHDTLNCATLKINLL